MIKNPVKKVAAIHDLSGFGRASLTAIIPILSNMGVQVCPFPTAVLSTHTGGFEGFTFVDLTDTMESFMDHWRRENIEFNCIYSGFLGSPRQIDIISKFISDFNRTDNLIVVDPVLGDNGLLYKTMNNDMVEKMRDLIKQANIITPNFTEAALLLNKPYCKSICESEIKNWLVELSNFGPNIVIITSVLDPSNPDSTNVIAYDKDNNKFWKVSCEYIPAFFPGTGDAFTSVFIGSILQGDSLPMALDRSVNFIKTAIRASYGFNYPQREGVLIEKVLDTLKMPITVSSYQLLK